MSTPTLKELLEKATPGPWVSAESGIYNDIIIRTPERPNRIPLYEMVAEAWTKNGMPAPMAQANAQLIARCNPATMAKVVEALERANKTFAYSEGAHGNDALFAIREALNLLNGKPTQ